MKSIYMFAMLLGITMQTNAQPNIFVDKTKIDFGLVDIGQSKIDSVCIVNTGDATLTLSTIINPDPPFTTDNIVPTPITLEPFDTLYVKIVFLPVKDGIFADFIDIKSNDPSIPSRIVDLCGATPFKKLQVMPPVVDFGVVPIGQSQMDSLCLTNVGSIDLSVSLVASPDPPFAADNLNDDLTPITPFTLKPGEVRYIDVFFSPTSPGTFTDEVLIEYNPTLSVKLQGATSGPKFGFLDRDKFFGDPGGTMVANVGLDTETEVHGVQLRLRFLCEGVPTDQVKLDGIINDLENLGLDLSFHTDENLVTSILMFNLDGKSFPIGSYALMELVLKIASDATLGKEIDIEIIDTVLSDGDSRRISHEGVPGFIKIGQRGDLTGDPLTGQGDGVINILDIVKMIKFIIRLIPLPLGDSFDFLLTDANEDNEINILDLVSQLKMINDPPSDDIVFKSGPVNPVLAQLDEWIRSDRQLLLPVRLDTDGPVTALQAELSFDPTKLFLGPPQLTERGAGMELHYEIQDGILRLVIFSITGQTIPAGEDGLFLIPVTLQNASQDGEVNLTEIILSDHQARSIPVTVTTSARKVYDVPTTFSLNTNSPNPFNPSTRIAYEVPERAHLTLIIYNILGQEVIRLVDEIKVPGRYVTTWDGRNAKGLSVGSGVYIYRLTSNKGFTQSRRMTLLK